VAVSTPSGTVTFLFTDIEGSTRLWQAEETAMRAALSRHDELLRKTVAEHDGVVFSSTGDGIAAVFESASSAVWGGVDISAAAGDGGVADRHADQGAHGVTYR
jgi:class 3 adenylate cyclase